MTDIVPATSGEIASINDILRNALAVCIAKAGGMLIVTDTEIDSAYTLFGTTTHLYSEGEGIIKFTLEKNTDPTRREGVTYIHQDAE